jgi:hypothetical protein
MFATYYHILILLEIICDDITANYIKSITAISGNDPIYPKLVLASGLEFMSRCAYKHIDQIYGMLIDSAKRDAHKFWNVMIFNPAFRLALPHTLKRN